ncbi:MAG: phenylalanine--tRNA ligase beta subunit-related protein [Candidatus Methanospirare jalkutatii]|nr:phenylalanine--tRNA ligase beta subunit-related protein [Candidatus Methanospirare jalkutatii]
MSEASAAIEFRFSVEERVRQKFEDIHIGVAILQDVRCSSWVGEAAERGRIEREEIERERREVEEEIRRTYDLHTLKDVPLLRIQRDFFWRMGVDPTKVRPASEALIRRILAGSGLPSISPVVDACNIASVKTLITFSAFDLERLSKESGVLHLKVRFASEGEEVTLIGNRKRRLTGRELVLTDAEKVLCVYVHGDVEATKVREDTKNVLLVAYGVPKLPLKDLERGLAAASEYVRRFAGGEEVFRKIF